MWPERELFLPGPTREIQSGQGRIGLISPTQVANHNTVMIPFILSTYGFSHLINQLLTGFLGHSLPWKVDVGVGFTRTI